ncbi:MAG: uracil-DNA glycosylase [Opitutales bacterium]
MDPAEALEALLEELRLRKAEGEKYVKVSDESLHLLRSLAGAVPAEPSRPAAPVPTAEGGGRVSRAPGHSSSGSAGSKPSRARPVAAEASKEISVAEPPRFDLPPGTKEERLRWIRERILACPETARHLRPGTAPVLGQGPADAEIVFVGEAPSAEDIRAGAPFCGDSGALLRKILAAAGIQEKEVMLLPAMGWRPESASEFIKRAPTSRELAFNRPYLLAQIAAVSPKAVVGLGAVAMEALVGSAVKMNEVRGKWTSVAGLPLLPTFHPNYLLHNPSDAAKRTVWDDFLSLLERMGRPVTEKQRGFFSRKA